MYSRYNSRIFLLIFSNFDTKFISALAWTKFFGQKSPIMYNPVLGGFPVRFSFWAPRSSLEKIPSFSFIMVEQIFTEMLGF